MKLRPGYRTSEFWFTVVSFVFSGLYLTGILTENEHKEELISVVSHAVESVILVGGQLYILYKYVKGRSEVKKIVEQEKLVSIEQKIEENKDDSKRTNTSTSRKNNTRAKTKSTKSKKSSSK